MSSGWHLAASLALDPDVQLSTNLPLRHFRAGFFEDLAFARGQALDAVRGNFVEDRVHFVLQKFVGGKFFVGLAAAERQNFFALAGGGQFARSLAARGNSNCGQWPWKIWRT